MHPHDRLKREVLGERLVCDRPFISDILGRDKPLALPRTVPGEAVKARTCEIKYKRVWLEPGPNSPLLKRIVKYPYVFDEMGRVRRSRIPMGLSERKRREPFPRPSAMLKAYRGPIQFGNPIKRFPFRSIPLEKAPPVSDWLCIRGDA